MTDQDLHSKEIAILSELNRNVFLLIETLTSTGNVQCNKFHCNQSDVSIHSNESFKISQNVDVLGPVQPHSNSETLNTSKAQTKKNNPSVPIFNSEKKNSDPLVWCDMYEKYLIETGLPERNLIRSLISALKGRANEWLRRKITPEMKWPEIKNLFLDSFSNKLAVKLFNLQSMRPFGRETLQKYAIRVMDYISFCWHRMDKQNLLLATILVHIASFDSRVQQMVSVAEITKEEELMTLMTRLHNYVHINNVTLEEINRKRCIDPNVAQSISTFSKQIRLDFNHMPIQENSGLGHNEAQCMSVTNANNSDLPLRIDCSNFPIDSIDFIARQLEITSCKIKADHRMVYRALLNIGVSLEQILNIYIKLVSVNERVWLATGDELHISQVCALLLECARDEIPMLTPAARRRCLARCKDLHEATLSALQALPYTQRLIDRISNAQAYLDRID